MSHTTTTPTRRRTLGPPPDRRRGFMLLATALALVAVSTVGVLAFTGEDDTPAPAPTASSAPTQPQSSPSPTMNSEQAAAAEKALAAYRASVASTVRAFNADGALQEKLLLLKNVVGPELTKTRELLSEDVRDGVRWRGKPIIDPTVLEVCDSANRSCGGKWTRPGPLPPTVVIADCFDFGTWEPFSKATGRSLRPPGQKLQQPVLITVRFVIGDWNVWDSKADPSRTSC